MVRSVRCYVKFVVSPMLGTLFEICIAPDGS